MWNDLFLIVNSNISFSQVQKIEDSLLPMKPSYNYVKGHKDNVNCILNHPMGLFTGSEARTVRQWDIRQQRSIKCLKGDIYDEVSCLSAYPDDDYLLCVGCDTAVLLYDIRNTEVILNEAKTSITMNMDCVNRIQPVKAKDSKYLAICDDKGFVLLSRDSV